MCDTHLDGTVYDHLFWVHSPYKEDSSVGSERSKHMLGLVCDTSFLLVKEDTGQAWRPGVLILKLFSQTKNTVGQNLSN